MDVDIFEMHFDSEKQILTYFLFKKYENFELLISCIKKCVSSYLQNII
jgi:hypothetical protein